MFKDGFYHLDLDILTISIYIFGPTEFLDKALILPQLDAFMAISSKNTKCIDIGPFCLSPVDLPTSLLTYLASRYASSHFINIFNLTSRGRRLHFTRLD